MNSTIDFSSPSTQFSFDVNKSQLFKKDQQNFINVLGVSQLNSLKNLSMLDTYLSKGNIVEPHYHQNAAELVYCISGCATVSIFNPFMKQLMQFTIMPGQVANVPQGWWHFIEAQADHTHFLAIFDANTPEVILGSDILKFTPSSIMARTYCIDEQQWKQTTAPVKPNTFIGPYKDCHQNHNYQQPYHHSHPSHFSMPVIQQPKNFPFYS
ncbi:cupin domain-containing protein [Lysinibacillus sp. SGAir0095]|uniref:cupin domain-containing protein n=1 Tax=Lysinibacillus sp. SGAir0095 TaxID=2070463 RepID=UPI0010CD6B88|nr:cupin domain-containing protein [Lysinibacillus sp. SGAir0095]QCR32636.1 cupin domain-containing protein [Lysinibacillus sp. SGAir0095]